MSRRLIFGFHAINARLRQNACTIDEIYIDENRQDSRMKQTLQKIQAAHIRLIAADNERLTKLCGTNGHQGIVALARPLPQQDLCP